MCTWTGNTLHLDKMRNEHTKWHFLLEKTKWLTIQLIWLIFFLTVYYLSIKKLVIYSFSKYFLSDLTGATPLCLQVTVPRTDVNEHRSKNDGEIIQSLQILHATCFFLSELKVYMWSFHHPVIVYHIMRADDFWAVSTNYLSEFLDVLF